MFKDTGTSSPDLCFSLILIWHILWLKRGSRYAYAKFMPVVVVYSVGCNFCCKLVKSRADLSIIADNVSGDVETFAYTSEYSKYNFFMFKVFTFLKFFLMAGCVYMIMPLHDCVYVQMHVFKGSIRILFCVP